VVVNVDSATNEAATTTAVATSGRPAPTSPNASATVALSANEHAEIASLRISDDPAS
jgi:hypothetical protein